jgi:TonB family protein
MPEPPPRPPPVKSLARPPEPKYDYHDWGYFAKTTGSVLVELTIDPRGTVRNARVVRSLNAAIDKRAVATARTFEFFPALNPWGEPTWGLHRWEFVIGPGGSSFLPVHRR